MIRKLDLTSKGLIGQLDLKQFPDLEEVNCADNYLTSCKTSPSVKSINLAGNCIKSMQDLNCNWDTLQELNIANNPIDFQEFTALFLKVKVLERNQQETEDQSENIKKHKELLDEASSKLTDAQKENKRLSGDLDQKKQELASKKGKVIPEFQQLINVQDLDNFIINYDYEQEGGSEYKQIIGGGLGSLNEMAFQQLNQQVLARVLIAQNRLINGEDEKYETEINN
ncbi:5932_t:CDS:2 [Ambispora gerdemannii]|uniref:5932_t:CDS:1 n=1 Tax=Ambispora gerdemannii TaxID=144530 RepID=A0A9N8YN39_9GLOM|nr:5932_t:CDS:2 [Ambispora gerdemannii]